MMLRIRILKEEIVLGLTQIHLLTIPNMAKDKDSQEITQSLTESCFINMSSIYGWNYNSLIINIVAYSLCYFRLICTNSFEWQVGTNLYTHIYIYILDCLKSRM